ILWGGLPQRFDFVSRDAMISYLRDVFNSIVLKDIVKRNNIKNIDLFERVMEYLVNNPSQTFSPANMMNEFSKENIPVSSKTIYECLDYAISNVNGEKISI